MQEEQMRQAKTAAQISLALLLIGVANAAHEKKPPKLEAMQKVCEFTEAMKDVTAYAATHVEKTANTVRDLDDTISTLQQLLMTEGANNKAIRQLARLANKNKLAILSELPQLAKQAAEAAATCANLAGRTEEFVKIFYKAHEDQSNTCIEKGGGPRAHTDLTCFKGNGVLKDLHLRIHSQVPDINNKYLAIANLGSGLQHGANNNCNLMDGTSASNVYTATQNNNLGIDYGNGMLTTNTADPSGSAINWEPKGKSSITEGKFASCQTTLSKITGKPAAATMASSEQLLKLNLEVPDTIESITIASEEFGPQDPKTAITIQKPQLNAIQAAIKALKSKTGQQAAPAADPNAAFFKRLAEINWTACEVGAKPNTKENCEVTKTEPPKCNDKEQGDCGKKAGCEWKNSTCKLTEGEQKETERAKQEAGKDGKTDSKCTGKEQKDCKSPDCKWEGKCQDFSFLVNKQFALSVVSAAFVALLF
uniref:Variant surface glycoprotein 1125.4673 n=1 Tax=Trypanosoma brucei TaxID=5691 RepID=A0A1J0RAE2_9TRYP|nr:variant surface glycoprotein 1125.4673 [Trypanosoma brucei]